MFGEWPYAESQIIAVFLHEIWGIWFQEDFNSTRWVLLDTVRVLGRQGVEEGGHSFVVALG